MEQLGERLDVMMKFKTASKITAAGVLAATLALAMGITVRTYAASLSADNHNDNAAGTAPQFAVSGSGILPDHTEEIAISVDIDNGGIEIVSSACNEIKASYDKEYYDVDITNKNGKWIISLSGKVERMGEPSDVLLYVPDVKRTMDVRVRDGNFSYVLPEECTDNINITAVNAGIDFYSQNQYKNSAISLVAADRDFIKYEPPVFPDYFTKTATGFVYTNGTKQNKIDISLTGYTSVNFLEKPAAVSEPAVNVEAYTVFDATTNLNDSTITATDHFNSSDIPKRIADWMLTCRGSDKVNVKRSAGDGTVDTWIYYDSDSRMAWKMAADGNTIKIVLTDNVPELIQGATLIHYQAPEAYQDLEVFFKSEKLEVNVQ